MFPNGTNILQGLLIVNIHFLIAISCFTSFQLSFGVCVLFISEYVPEIKAFKVCFDGMKIRLKHNSLHSISKCAYEKELCSNIELVCK